MADQVTKTIIVKTDPTSAYRLWADFENFPKFMKYIESVRKTGEGRSHWVVAGPLGRKVEWEAETTRLEPPKRIAWSTKDHSSVTTSGQVTFNDLGHDETEVTVTMHYVAPAGAAGDIITDLFSNPDKRVEEDLKHFKRYAESM
jgi:uncharacterized membrane protein